MLSAQDAIRGLQSWQDLSRRQLADHAERLQTDRSDICSLQYGKQDADASEEEKVRRDREILYLKT